MATVHTRDGEPVEKLLRRFKKKVEAAGILKDLRKHEFFTKPTEKRKLKRLAADKRRKRSERRVSTRA